jgi:hypothetical protein
LRSRKIIPAPSRNIPGALRIIPDYAEALLRRGFARRLDGDKAGGDADVAAAKKINPNLVD